jgi:hypothetical protein
MSIDETQPMQPPQEEDPNPYEGTELQTKFRALRGMVCAALDEYTAYTEEFEKFDTPSLSQKFLPGRRDGVLIHYMGPITHHMLAAVSFIGASMGKVDESAFEAKKTEVKAEIEKEDKESAAVVRDMLAEATQRQGEDPNTVSEAPRTKSVSPRTKSVQAGSEQKDFEAKEEVPQDARPQASSSETLQTEEKAVLGEFKELNPTDIERLKKRLKDAGHHCLVAITFSKHFVGDPAVKEAMNHMAFLSVYFFGAWMVLEFFRKCMTDDTASSSEKASLKPFTLPLGLTKES